MLDTPQITETADQLTASISLIVPREEIQTVMGPSIREVIRRPRRPGDRPGWAVVHPPPAEAHGHLRLRHLRPGRDAGGRDGPGEAGSASRRAGGPDGLPRALRGARGRLGRVLRLDRGQWAHTAGGPVGVLPFGPESSRDPADYRHGTQPPVGRLGIGRSGVGRLVCRGVRATHQPGLPRPGWWVLRPHECGLHRS